MTPQGGLGPERFTILQMVQDGTITPDEGARLLEAMDRSERTAPPPPPAPPAARNVRIRVINNKGDHDVDIVLPFGLVNTGLNLAHKIAPGKVPDLSEIRHSIQQGYTGRLFNVDNGNDHIEISIETGTDSILNIDTKK